MHTKYESSIDRGRLCCCIGFTNGVSLGNAPRRSGDRFARLRGENGIDRLAPADQSNGSSIGSGQLGFEPNT